jgi:small subunit ribosomal protein S19
MNRPEWKGPYICENKINNIKNLKKTYNALIMPRDIKIFPKFLGLTVKVHNGKKYIEFTINEDMIGHRFGEFSSTRGRFSFKKKKSKK